MSKTRNRVNVIGVGMTKFATPGASAEYNVMAAKATPVAPAAAKVPSDAVDQASAGNVYGASTGGTRARYRGSRPGARRTHPHPRPSCSWLVAVLPRNPQALPNHGFWRKRQSDRQSLKRVLRDRFHWLQDFLPLAAV